MGTVKEDGTLNEKETDIFNIRGTTERQILNEKKYNFEVYRGTNGKKALLTYNNDYKGEIKEGFRYRIIDYYGKSSEEQKLELPYPDRLCNIEDVVYDDTGNKVYMLCDLFTLSGKNRNFEKSFISFFDLNKNLYCEIDSGIPVFYENKIQHLIKQNIISFSGLGFNEEEQNKWTSSFMQLDLYSFTIKDSAYYVLNVDTVKNFFGKNKKMESQFLLPLNFTENKKESYLIGWNFFYDLDFSVAGEKDRRMTINRYGIMFGLGGGIAVGLLASGIAAAVTSGDQFNNYRRSLWFNYDFREKKFKEFTIPTNFHASEYYLHSLACIQRDDTTWALRNNFPQEQKYYSSVCALNLNTNLQSCDSTFSAVFKKGIVNFIYPQSMLYDKGTYYFLGAYDPDNDPTKDKYRLEYTTYLIKIKE